ncbi:MAG: FAD:protein FMN transferase [Lentimicrobium sp.]|jgi:thiamine biosynthesis lipoprotein|nr:FAD:protein FMN transferase [Lentimicrobium sp.]
MMKYTYILLLATVLLGCNSHKQEISFTGMAQGTYYAITYYDEQGRNFQPEIEDFFREFDTSASIYIPHSIISRFNQNDTSALADDIFTYVFNISAKVSEQTDGAFDITTMPLTNAWGFGFTDSTKIAPKLVDSLLQFVNYNNVKLVNRKIVKTNPGIMLDYNAIAQGYSADLIGDILQSKGITDYLVDVGGEVVGHGTKPNGSYWRVGIEKPTENASDARSVESVVLLNNSALATSGNYRKFFVKDGIRYSHTIDPKTGYPVKHSLLSASVLAADGITADAYATAFMVMGLEKSKEFLKNHPELEAHFIFSLPDGKYSTWTSPGLEKMMEKQ